MSLEQRGAVRERWRRERWPTAGRHRDVPDPAPQPLGDAARLLLPGSGQHGHELLAAEPAQHVAGPHVLAQRAGRRGQQLVPGQMPIGVVDPLEMVDVHEQDRGGPAGAPGPADPLLRLPLPGDGVEQAGLRVGLGGRAQLLVQQAALEQDDRRKRDDQHGPAERAGDGDQYARAQPRRVDQQALEVPGGPGPGHTGPGHAGQTRRATTAADRAARPARAIRSALTSTNSPAQHAAPSTISGSRSHGPCGWTRLNRLWNSSELAAPANPSAAAVNARQYSGPCRARQCAYAPISTGPSIAYCGGSSSAAGSHQAVSRSWVPGGGAPPRRVASTQTIPQPRTTAKSPSWSGTGWRRVSCQAARMNSVAVTAIRYARSRRRLGSRSNAHGASGRRLRPAAVLTVHRALDCRHATCPSLPQAGPSGISVTFRIREAAEL